MSSGETQTDKITMLIVPGLETSDQSTGPMLTQRGKQGISTLLNSPQWVAVPALHNGWLYPLSPITTLTTPQNRLYWESPGDLPVLHYIMPWEQL